MGKSRFELFPLFKTLIQFRYTCFFTPKLRSPCFHFQNDIANFKGADGVLLCYKTHLFEEIQRYQYEQSEDNTTGKPVSSQLYFFGNLYDLIHH